MTTPLLSVIIPTYNRESDLRRVLSAYEHQIGDVPFEIVVVDDGSSDGTQRLLHQWRRRNRQLVFDTQENAGPARARNRGLELATGQLVLFTGDDILPSRDLLLRHVEAHERVGDERVAILGHISWPDDLDITVTMRHVDGVGAQQFSYHYFEPGESYDFRHFYTSNISVSRALLDREPKGFSTDFKYAAFEDAELAYRLRRHGLDIVYRPEPRSVHYHPYTVSSFFLRQMRCGQMASLFHTKYPELRKWFELRHLDELRLDSLERRFLRRGRDVLDGSAETARRYDQLEQRALRLAGFFDYLPVPPIDDLLRAVFHYGYLKGVAAGSYPEDLWLQGALFEAEVVPAVATFSARMALRGLPIPAADAAPILELAA